MSKKPPKPADRPSSPRTKRKQEERVSRDSVLAELSALTDIAPDVSYYERYAEEMRAEKNERGIAILLATNLENILEEAIKRHMWVVRSRRELFGINSPLGTFSSKIRIGYALGIFGPETLANLDVIRAIRNVFAHAKIPVQFTEPRLMAACSLLRIPSQMLPPVARPADWRPETPEELDAITGRDRFKRVCEDTMHNLFMRSMRGPHQINAKEITTAEGTMITTGYTVWSIPLPLP